MKTNNRFALLAAMILGITACDTDNHEGDLSTKIHFFSGVNRYETRVSDAGDKWTAGDAIGLFMTENNSSIVVNNARNISYTAQSSEQSSAFLPTNEEEAISYPEGAGDVDFIAYYPYKEAAVSFIYPISLANQATGYAKNDLLYAVSRNHDAATVESVSLTFAHQLVRLTINVVLEEGLSEVTAVSIKGCNSASFNLVTGEIEERGEVSSIIPYNGETNLYEAILLPTELSDSDKVLFTVDGAKYEWVMANNEAEITELVANTSYTFSITIVNNQVVAELVSIENGSLTPWEEETGSGTAEKIPGSEESSDLPEAIYFNGFDTTDGLTIVGEGSFVTDSDDRFGTVFQNATGGMRTNYLLLPEDILSHSSSTEEMSIGMWVNAKNAGESATYAWSPLFTAHATAPIDGENTWPMFGLFYRGTMQVNCAGYCDFDVDQNVAGKNTLYHNAADWLADGDWHYYTVTMTATSASIYFDGALKNQWILDDTSLGQILSGLFSDGSDLTYIALGGNQVFNYGDPDPGFMFDDFVVYDQALNESQIAAIIAAK